MIFGIVNKLSINHLTVSFFGHIVCKTKHIFDKRFCIQIDYVSSNPLIKNVASIVFIICNCNKQMTFLPKVGIFRNN